MPLYTYPSNKLEYLVEILSKLLNLSKKNIFDQPTILIGSRGMQHWLSMELAQQNNITMNIKFDMINSFILNACYDITSSQSYKKKYTKEVLSWRIFNLLDKINNSKLKIYYKNNSLKKYQLSSQIANVFNKYIKYRSSWLEKWQNNKFIENSAAIDENWQAQLWRLLIEENDKTPIKIQDEAILKLKSAKLPQEIYIFGISTASPSNLKFLFELSKHTNIHILYLNPSSEYWYDLKKSKIANHLNLEDLFSTQPLLANFGQQGKDFFNQILEFDQQEFTSFENFNAEEKTHSSKNDSLLANVQRNILKLNTKRYKNSFDKSIIINSCHSPFREIQILHDNLLDFLENDTSLTPKDILVMCPNIEDYAPYVDAVFNSSQHNANCLPCSIADRTIINSESLAASFIEILKLPDSKFEVTKIIDYLSTPALQSKFDINLDQLETIKYWLAEACIYRGLSDDCFSWNWGLKRLLLGFCLSDSPKMIKDSFQTLPNIQTNDIQNLGKLYQFIEILQILSKKLNKKRTASQWQIFLIEIFESLFNIDNHDRPTANIIKQNILKLSTYTKEANFKELMELSVVRNILTSALSQPLVNNHFLQGKITFCSMTAMRNIPFKIIAMLGLNNTNYPRKELKNSYDLTNYFPLQKGDRIKNEDDRYLFLESIVSARSHLYLSYQGNSFKNNTKQESSFVIKEFYNYLNKYYNWDGIQQYPLHPFSIKCYSKNYQSYNHKWLKLIKSSRQDFYSNLNNDIDIPTKLSLEAIVKIFDNPFKAFSKHSLSLDLSDNKSVFPDSEPFDIDPLNEYNIKKILYDTLEKNKNINNKIKNLQLSGKYPLSPITIETLYKNLESTTNLFTSIKSKKLENIDLSANIDNFELYTQIHINQNSITMYKISNIKIKDKFLLYLQCLTYNYIYNQEINGQIIYLDKDSKQKTFKINNIDFNNTKKELSFYIKKACGFLQIPTLAHIKFLEIFLNKDKDNYYKLFNNQEVEKVLNFYTNSFKRLIKKQKSARGDNQGQRKHSSTNSSTNYQHDAAKTS